MKREDIIPFPTYDNSFSLPFPLITPMGLIPRISGHNVVGRSVNVDSGALTDLWDNSATTKIWVAPTQARLHNIVSSSASDDGDPAGVGARTVRIWGLKTWTSNEVTEDVTLNGTSNVSTANSYVIIHHMEVLTKGATDVNVGAITATAVTDGTVTCAILAGRGQSDMGIRGIPSTMDAYITNVWASFIKNAASSNAYINLLYNPEPSSELTNFNNKLTRGLDSNSDNGMNHPCNPHKKLTGPGIIKIQADGSAANLTITGGFDFYLVEK